LSGTDLTGWTGQLYSWVRLAELTSFNRAMKAIYDYWNPQDIFILKWWGIIGEEVDLEGM